MNGILYCTNRWATFGIVIRDGRVVDTAPYAWRWINGSTVENLIDRLIGQYDVEWIGDDRR